MQPSHRSGHCRRCRCAVLVARGVAAQWPAAHALHQVRPPGAAQRADASQCRPLRAGLWSGGAHGCRRRCCGGEPPTCVRPLLSFAISAGAQPGGSLRPAGGALQGCTTGLQHVALLGATHAERRRRSPHPTACRARRWRRRRRPRRSSCWSSTAGPTCRPWRPGSSCQKSSGLNTVWRMTARRSAGELSGGWAAEALLRAPARLPAWGALPHPPGSFRSP